MALLRSSAFLKSPWGNDRYRTFQYAVMDIDQHLAIVAGRHRQFWLVYSTNAQPLDAKLRYMEYTAHCCQSVTRNDVNDMLEAIRKENMSFAQSVTALMCFGYITSNNICLRESSMYLTAAAPALFVLLAVPPGGLMMEEQPEERTKQSQQPWDVMESLEIINEKLTELKSKGLTPNRFTYHRIIEKCSHSVDPNDITNVIEIIKAQHIRLDGHNALIYAYGAAGEIDASKGIIETMTNDGLHLTHATHLSLLRAYAKRGDLTDCLAQIERPNGEEVTIDDKDILDQFYEFATS